MNRNRNPNRVRASKSPVAKLEKEALTDKTKLKANANHISSGDFQHFTADAKRPSYKMSSDKYPKDARYLYTNEAGMESYQLYFPPGLMEKLYQEYGILDLNEFITELIKKQLEGRDQTFIVLNNSRNLDNIINKNDLMNYKLDKILSLLDDDFKFDGKRRNDAGKFENGDAVDIDSLTEFLIQKKKGTI